MGDEVVFHAGEQALQSRAGVRERLASLGRVVVRDHMPEPHRELFRKLPTLLLAVQDDTGQVWASMLHGAPGFIASPDAQTLQVRAWPAPGDPVGRWLTEGCGIGLLGIEPHTRRRNRANGRVQALREAGFDVQVLQSFGNCPKYIHARSPGPRPWPGPASASALPLGPQLDATTISLLRRADTLFIASANAVKTGTARADGVDVSHRGGQPGFVTVAPGPEGLRLTVPDYVGNSYFNTLGNLALWPLAGLLVPDFDDGSLLHVAAQASVTFEGPDLAAYPGAQRLLHLDVTSAWWRPMALPLCWSVPEAPSP